MAVFYNKLPEEIQVRIDNYVRENIKEYVRSNLLREIKEKRKNNIKEFINMRGKDLLYSFYYWIVIPDKDNAYWETGYNAREKYKAFFRKLFPAITDLSTINKVYEHYYSITRGSINSFTNLCIDNISIEEAEDFYNYTLFTYFLTNINYSPLTKSSKIHTSYQLDRVEL
tara:strand:- start:92 stop:601 length:510 start_codon:yes stop_codon:yes gene_type:complete